MFVPFVRYRRGVYKYKPFLPVYRVSEHKLPNISFVPIITRTQILTSDYNTNIISEDESKASEDDPKMTKDFRRLPNRNSHYNINLNPKYANRSQFLIT